MGKEMVQVVCASVALTSVVVVVVVERVSV